MANYEQSPCNDCKWLEADEGGPMCAKQPPQMPFVQRVKECKHHKHKILYRLNYMFKILVTNFGEKNLENYSQEEFHILWANIQGNSNFRKQAKDAYLNQLRNFWDYLNLPSQPEIFTFNFTESVYVWETPRDPNREKVLEFLGSIQNSETQARYRKKLGNALRFFYDNFGIKPILEYETTTFKKFFLHIDKKSTSKKEKGRYREALKIFIESLTAEIEGENQLLPHNYPFIFSNRFFTFKEAQKRFYNKHTITKKEFIAFFSELRQKDALHYVLFRMFLTASRGKGVSNIIVKNINFDMGYLETQDKATHNSAGFNRYYFPKDYDPELRAYIQKNNLQANDRLFRYSAKRILYTLHKYRTWGNHDFRRSILRLWRLAGMDLIDRNFLSCHENPPEAVMDAKYSGDSGKIYLKSVYDYYDELIFHSSWDDTNIIPPRYTPSIKIR